MADDRRGIDRHERPAGGQAQGERRRPPGRPASRAGRWATGSPSWPVAGKTVAPPADWAGSAIASWNASWSEALRAATRRIDVLLGHPRELLAIAARRRLGVGDLEEQPVLAARHAVDRVRVDVAVRAALDRRHLDAGPGREDGQADELGPRHGDRDHRPEADIGAGRHEAPGDDPVRARRVEVLEPDGPGRLGQLDPLAGRRERVVDGDRDGHELGRDDGAGRVGRGRGRVGDDRDLDRSDRLRPWA